MTQRFKHGLEVRELWAEYQRRHRARKMGIEYSPKEVGSVNLLDEIEEIPIITYILTITEDEEKLWALKNIFKRGLLI